MPNWAAKIGLQAIAQNLRAAGFTYLIVNGADNAAVHGTEMLRRALPEEHYVDEREPGAALGACVADAHPVIRRGGAARHLHQAHR